MTDKPQFKDFNPEKIAETEYPITKYQPIYFVAESFESAKEKVRYSDSAIITKKLIAN